MPGIITGNLMENVRCSFLIVYLSPGEDDRQVGKCDLGTAFRLQTRARLTVQTKMQLEEVLPHFAYQLALQAPVTLWPRPFPTCSAFFPWIPR